MLYQEEIIAGILKKVDDDIDISEDDAITLLSQTNKDLINKIRQSADHLRCCKP